MTQKNLVLGIDIGTTSVKVCVIDVDNNEILSKHVKDTQANVPSELGKEGNKQDVPKIISALNACVARLKKDLLRQISKIGICGQMHGLMLWNTGEEKAWESIRREDGSLVRYDVRQDAVSALYTWQDSRCEPEFLASLPSPNSHLPTYSGYGNATLFWMAKYKPEKLSKYNCAGTIQDFAVTILSNLDRPKMSVQNAASWGYFDCVSKQWNMDILKETNFPVQFLPEVEENGSIAGCLIDNWHSIPKGTPIGVALGDLQCSVLATLEQPYDAVLNISTSAQLAFVAEKFVPEEHSRQISCIEYFPYFNGKYLAVAASLNGGNVLATFVQMLQLWTMELGFCVPQSTVWEKLLTLGVGKKSSMQIDPTILGERNFSDKSASVQNIHIGNLGLGAVFQALCRGLIENLYKMMPREVLLEADIQRIVGNGSGLSRNKILQQEVRELYQLPLVFTAGGDAAKGAALAVAGKNNLQHKD